MDIVIRWYVYKCNWYYLNIRIHLVWFKWKKIIEFSKKEKKLKKRKNLWTNDFSKFIAFHVKIFKLIFSRFLLNVYILLNFYLISLNKY